MPHMVHLGPGSCDGQPLVSRRFLAQWLKAEAVARGFVVDVIADDGPGPVLFVPDPGRDDGPQTDAWVTMTIFQLSNRLDHIDPRDVRPWKE